MPKPNQTMLDKLAETFKSTGKKKPQLLRITYPNSRGGYSTYDKLYPNAVAFDGRVPDLTPERVKYQRGIEARLIPKKIAADELVDETYSARETIQDEWNDAVSDAKESMRDDWETGLDYQEFEDVDPYYLEADAPNTDLREYWPDYSRSPEEISDAYTDAAEKYFDAALAKKRIYGPQGIMDEQMLTPRYRNYQRAMRQREENARIGRLNAAIMNLYRQGYSMPEIREILRNQRGR